MGAGIIGGRWLNDVPQAKLVTYSGVGHIPMEEIPAETLKDFETFLSQGLTPFSDSLAAARENEPDRS